MLTLNTILKELRNVPVNRLEDLYSVIRSFSVNKKTAENKKAEILSYAGCFSDMSDEDFNDFNNNLKNTRSQLFDREIDL